MYCTAALLLLLRQVLGGPDNAEALHQRRLVPVDGLE
jgi:hypothetical protein